jgi:2,3-bisphosphoglycerate-dependent phosphoglycerate mutase
MTTVYFIRHAQANNTVRDGRIRPLTEKGMRDRILVTEFLRDKNIDVVLSSPFKRAIDTIADFAEKNNSEVEIIEDFRERRSDIDFTKETFGFDTFMERQWADFNYTYSDGECLAEVQNRNIAALSSVLDKYKDKTIAIGTHGTALSTIINYYDQTYGFTDFMAMVDMLPWVVKMKFDGANIVGMWKIDLFEPNKDSIIHTVLTPELETFKGYEVVAIFVRYKNKWLYGRAKTRDVFEMIGGGIEIGETPLQAAKRELYEETGAINYTIKPICDYRGVSNTRLLNGQLFYAEILELGDLPKEFEMAEVKLFETIPEKMRFPELLPVLFEKVKVLI